MLTVGVQYHKVLDKKKLFCSCKFLNEKTILDRDYLVKLEQKMYRFGNTSAYCRYQREESPPVMNFGILRKAIRCVKNIPGIKLVNTLVFSRKRILDGSLVSGYQRTAVLGHSGSVVLSTGKIVPIRRVYLEEDSCGRIDNCYTVSRMGLPLVQVVTEAIEMTSGEVVQLLKLLDELLNSNFNTPRTNYARRQDVNLSGPTGYRVEYKGVSKLSHVSKIMALQQSNPFEGTQEGTPTLVYNADLNERVLLRYTQKSERMSYESQVEPIEVKNLKTRSTAGIEIKDPELRGKVLELLRNSKDLKFLKSLERYELRKQDYWVLVSLSSCYTKRNLWRLFRSYLRNQFSFEGLKANLRVKPLSIQELQSRRSVLPQREFYKSMKMYFPRNFSVRD